MNKLLILCSTLACARAAASPQHLKPLIVGGAPAEISQYPWQISLQRGGSHYCAGSIYSDKIIVTAAHCLQPSYECTKLPILGTICRLLKEKPLTVRAGSTHVNSGGVVISVAAYKAHEDFNIDTLINDIAVLRLESPLTYGSGIQNITLASTAPSNGERASVSGWGTTISGANTIPSNLQYANVTIIGLTECSSPAYGYGNKVMKTMICAADDGKDACQGDSGGPLVSGGKLVGIVSWGYGCANASYPGVYSDVAALRTWAEMAATTV